MLLMSTVPLHVAGAAGAYAFRVTAGVRTCVNVSKTSSVC